MIWPVQTVFGSRIADIRDRVNEGKVTVITGGINHELGYGEFYRHLGGDIAAALDKPNVLRVLPVLGYGSSKNIEDMLYLQGIDLGILHGDLLTYLKKHDRFPTAAKQLRYIAKLFDEQFHVLAHKHINNVLELTDKPVAMGGPDTGTYVSAITMFECLGVIPKPVFYDRTVALEKLKQGEIAAMVFTTTKPMPFIRKIRKQDKLQLLALPAPRDFPKIYTSTEFTHEDYPNLISVAESVKTLQFPTVLATYNRSAADNQFKNISRFVEQFFSNIEKLQKHPYDPLWRTLNPRAEVRGWQRFQVAEEWLASEFEQQQKQKRAAMMAMATKPVATQFEKLLDFLGNTPEDRGVDRESKKELEALYNRFQEWQHSQTR